MKRTFNSFDFKIYNRDERGHTSKLNAKLITNFAIIKFYISVPA